MNRQLKCAAPSRYRHCGFGEREKHTLRLWREIEREKCPYIKKICPGIFTVVVLFCFVEEKKRNRQTPMVGIHANN